MAPGAVCVTGAGGFLGSQITKDLLAKGYDVHAVVRSKQSVEEVAGAPTLPFSLQNFKTYEADVTVPESCDEALSMCEFAVHCASPVTMDTVKDPRLELVDPAVRGTMAFLESCGKAKKIRRIVVTGCSTAIADEGSSGVVLDERNWNEKSSLDRLPYYYSKTLSERVVWEWARLNPHVQVIVMNPTAIVGPSLIGKLGVTPKLIKQIIDGQEFPGILDLSWNFVNVKDVSKAHIAAMESELASGRYICGSSARPIHMREIVSKLRDMGYCPNTRNLTSSRFSSTARLMSRVVPGGQAGYFVRQQLGNPILLSNEKIKRDLGISFTDSLTSLEETVYDMVRWGHIEPAKPLSLKPRSR